MPIIGQEFGIRLKLKNGHWRVPVPAPGPCQAVCVTANTYNLFQQRHPFRVYIPAATDDAVQIYPTGHTCASGVDPVPYRLIASCCLHLIYQPHNLLAWYQSFDFLSCTPYGSQEAPIIGRILIGFDKWFMISVS